MDIKGFGELDPSPGLADSLDTMIGYAVNQVRLGRSVAADRPLSTGSLSVDYATGLGGLPRGCVVDLEGRTQPGEALLWSTLSETQNAGGVAVVLDPTQKFTRKRALKYGADFKRLIVVRPKSVEEALELVRRLVNLQGVDLVLVDALDEIANEASGWRPLASRLTARRLRRALDELQNSVHDSPTCLMVTHGVGPRVSWLTDWVVEHMSDLRLDVEPAKEWEADAVEEVQVEVTPPVQSEARRVTVQIGPTGQIMRLSDLIDPAISEELIERRGPALAYGRTELGSTRAEAVQALRENPDLALDLERRVEQALVTQRAESHMAFPGPDQTRGRGRRFRRQPHVPHVDETPDHAGAESAEASRWDAEEAEGPGDQPTGRPAARYVNTWFEGEGETLLPLVVGQAYSFKLYIGARKEEPEPGAQTAPFAEPDFGARQELDLLIGLYSEDFSIVRSQHPLVLPRVGPSPEIQTKVTPAHAGACRISIVVSLVRELELLQELEIEVAAKEGVLADSVEPSGKEA